MRGADGYNEALFTTIRLEEFVPANHPLRPIRTWLNEALTNIDARFAVTAIQREHDTQLVIIVTIHFETIRTPAGIAGRHGNTLLVPTRHPGLLHPAGQQ